MRSEWYGELATDLGHDVGRMKVVAESGNLIPGNLHTHDGMHLIILRHRQCRHLRWSWLINNGRGEKDTSPDTYPSGASAQA
jgi:hypothetical protein